MRVKIRLKLRLEKRLLVLVIRGWGINIYKCPYQCVSRNMCVYLCVIEMWDAAKIRISLRIMLQANSINVCQLTNSTASSLMKLSLFPLQPTSGMMDLISNEVVVSLTDWLRRFFVILRQDVVTDVDLVQTRAKMYWHTFWIKHEARLICLIL